MNRNVFMIRNYLDKLSKVLGSWSTFKFYWRTYVKSKIENIDPDIFIVSYPKCGRTWLRIMLLKYIELSGYSSRMLSDNSLIEISSKSILKFEHDKSNWVPAPYRLSKMNYDKKKYECKKMIFLIRDPRDVLVSSWYHLKFRENIYRKPLKDFIYDELTGIEKVVGFYNLFYDNRYVPLDFKILSYEDLHRNIKKNFTEVISFLGLGINDDNILEAINYSKFSKMSKMESSGILKEPWMKPGLKNELNSKKIRKGKIGGFREEFNNNEIKYLNNVIKEKLHPDLQLFFTF